MTTSAAWLRPRFNIATLYIATGSLGCATFVQIVFTRKRRKPHFCKQLTKMWLIFLFSVLQDCTRSRQAATLTVDYSIYSFAPSIRSNLFSSSNENPPEQTNPIPETSIPWIFSSCSFSLSHSSRVIGLS